MTSPTETFESQVILEDRRAVVRQLLSIRYETGDGVSPALIEKLAQMPSNQMLRLLLTHSCKELLENLEQELEDVNSSTFKQDLFKVIGPIEQYYLKKQGEREALEALAKFRFGEINHTIRAAITYLLQTSAKNAVQVLSTLSREELEAQFGHQAKNL